MQSQRSRITRVSLVILTAMMLLCTSVSIADKPSQPNFFAVGGTKQYHTNSNKMGSGSCSLISPNWILTAWHVAQYKAEHPNGGNFKAIFRKNSVERQIVKIYKAPGVDVALCKLARPVTNTNTPPVSLMQGKFVSKAADGTISFTQVGRATGLDYYRNRKGYGIKSGESFFHLKKNGSRPGKAGDSGGAFLIEGYCTHSHVQFSVIHGGGYGPQVGPLKDWIDTKLATTGDVATWVKKADINRTVDKTSPTITCPNDITLEYPADTEPEATGYPEVTDNCDSSPSLSYKDVVTGSCPLFITRTWKASDSTSNKSSCQQVITLSDTTAPDFGELSVTPDILWPPNNRMIQITPTWAVSDLADPDVEVHLKSVKHNEEGSGTGEILINDDGSIYLRAERSELGNGRVYTLTFEAVDNCGNTSKKNATVTVPHLSRSMGRRRLYPAVPQGPTSGKKEGSADLRRRSPRSKNRMKPPIR